jgi:hypothetical protein
MPVGPANNYPSLQTVADLFRSEINDTGSGQNGSTGGQIATNQAPFFLPFLNAAMRWLASKLRLANDQTLILDNYILYNLPPINSALGVGTPNPASQVALGPTGFFDGLIMWPAFTTPANFLNVQRVWERLTNSGVDFSIVNAAQDGLPPVMQVENFGYYEQRQDQIWFPGAQTNRDIRLRCTVQLLPYSGATLDFTNTFVPIFDSERVLAKAMCVEWAKSFSPAQYQMAVMDRNEALDDIRGEVIYAAQEKEHTRSDWDDGNNFFPWGTQL